MDRDQAAKFIHDLLSLMKSRKGSDLFISAGFPPAMKVDGRMTKVSSQALTGAHTLALARSMMNDKQAATFEAEQECNFAISPPGVGRYRVNAFIQQGCVGMVFRTIPMEIPTIDQLGLPAILKEIAMTKRGLVVFVGATGSGKSTSLAAMVDHRNANSYGHIITIEDPIEFVHPHKNCLITQREVGMDCKDWAPALKNTLRQAPDVILMGEIRDQETMEHAMAFAETGHLCLATLHANSANQAIDRIINFFPQARHKQLLQDLALNMRAFISQRLIPKEQEKGRAAAIEILLNSPLIADRIAEGEVGEIKDIMKRSREEGMQTFDQSLFALYEAGLISEDSAVRFADSQNEVRLLIKLESERKKSSGARVTDGISQFAILETRPAPLMDTPPARPRPSAG
jgi:twitching motility protein PilU